VRRKRRNWGEGRDKRKGSEKSGVEDYHIGKDTYMATIVLVIHYDYQL